MSRPPRTRPPVEALDARVVPSAALDAPPAFTGLDVAVEQFYATDPSSPVAVSQVLALNYGEASDEALSALAGLDDIGGDTTL